MICKTLHRKLDIEKQEPHEEELRYSGRVGMFCINSGIRCVTLVENILYIIFVT